MDYVDFGQTGLKVSRLSIGTGTHGWGGRSQQTALGLNGLANLLRQAYDHGVNFWDGRKPEKLDRVRNNRYVFLTGKKDFNRAETRRVHRAYRRADVENVLLLEVAGMDHRMPPVEDLATAITFLDSGPSPGQ